ncbi:hypothetical protein BSKO_05769 [Bryopsis sp. KO-2023]|nr:hypothetical protein BSKO_05769 [Bryopsis sp. KO-2023]
MLRERVQGLATGLQEIQTDDIVLGIKTALRERFVDGSKATRLVQYEQGEKDFEVAKSWDIYALGAIVLEMESPHVLRERPPSARLDDKWKNVIKVAQEYCGSAHCSILDMVITLEDLLETYETIRRKGRKRARVGLVEAEFRAHNLLANAEVAEFGAVRAIAEEELVAARAALDADTRWMRMLEAAPWFLGMRLADLDWHVSIS